MLNDCAVELSAEPVYYDENSDTAAIAFYANGEIISIAMVSEDGGANESSQTN
jgi:hypothetical protein